MRKLIIFLLFLIFSTPLCAQKVYSGVFYVKSIYGDSTYCDKQSITFAFKNDSSIYKLDGTYYLFTNSVIISNTSTGPNIDITYSSLCMGVYPYNLHFIIDYKDMAIFIYNDKELYPQFNISTLDICK